MGAVPAGCVDSMESQRNYQHDSRQICLPLVGFPVFDSSDVTVDDGQKPLLGRTGLAIFDSVQGRGQVMLVKVLPAR